MKNDIVAFVLLFHFTSVSIANEKNIEKEFSKVNEASYRQMKDLQNSQYDSLRTIFRNKEGSSPIANGVKSAVSNIENGDLVALDFHISDKNSEIYKKHHAAYSGTMKLFESEYQRVLKEAKDSTPSRGLLPRARLNFIDEYINRKASQNPKLLSYLKAKAQLFHLEKNGNITIIESGIPGADSDSQVRTSTKTIVTNNLNAAQGDKLKITKISVIPAQKAKQIMQKFSGPKGSIVSAIGIISALSAFSSIADDKAADLSNDKTGIEVKRYNPRANQSASVK